MYALVRGQRIDLEKIENPKLKAVLENLGRGFLFYDEGNVHHDQSGYGSGHVDMQASPEYEAFYHDSPSHKDYREGIGRGHNDSVYTESISEPKENADSPKKSPKPVKPKKKPEESYSEHVDFIRKDK